ncbi:hypothetical protein, partial [Burkholderia cenocepacia]|uniref:hypothetical protein n=2 Tax=Burkholderia cenocepacia TaxID=95486 RepID=UPI002AB0B1AE
SMAKKTKNNGDKSFGHVIQKYEVVNGVQQVTAAYLDEVKDAIRMGWPASEACRVYGVTIHQIKSNANGEQ